MPPGILFGQGLSVAANSAQPESTMYFSRGRGTVFTSREDFLSIARMRKRPGAHACNRAVLSSCPVQRTSYSLPSGYPLLGHGSSKFLNLIAVMPWSCSLTVLVLFQGYKRKVASTSASPDAPVAQLQQPTKHNKQPTLRNTSFTTVLVPGVGAKPSTEKFGHCPCTAGIPR